MDLTPKKKKNNMSAVDILRENYVGNKLRSAE